MSPTGDRRIFQTRGQAARHEQGGRMTETARTTRVEGADTPRLCIAGSSTESACWREATEPLCIGGKEPQLCAEHAAVLSLSHETDRALEDLDTLHGWFRQLAAPALGDQGDRGHLERHLEEAMEAILAEYFELRVQMKVAKAVAERREGEEPLSPEEATRMARPFLVGDAYMDARLILEDVPEDTYGSRDKWFIIATIARAAEEAKVGEPRSKGGS